MNGRSILAMQTTLLSHLAGTRQTVACLLLCMFLLSVGAHTGLRAQQTPTQQALALLATDTAQGVELYQHGDMKAAIKLLKKASKTDKTDVVAWQFLGLALKQQGDQKGAQKALAKAVDLRFQQLTGGFPFPGKKLTDLTKAEHAVLRAEQAQRDRAALAAVQSYLQVNPKDAPFWREQADSLLFYSARAETPADAEQSAYTVGEVTKRAIILAKPEPAFTEEARKKNITGEVMVRLVLAADSTVQHILVIKPLPYGLSQQAVAAARRVQFKPALIDGRPVSQFVTIVYNFNIY